MNPAKDRFSGGQATTSCRKYHLLANRRLYNAKYRYFVRMMDDMQLLTTIGNPTDGGGWIREGHAASPQQFAQQ